MKKVLFCSFLFTFFYFSVEAQKGSDSLSLSIKNEKALHIFLSDPDSAIAIATQTLDVAKEKNISYIEGQSYFILSKANWTKANFRLGAEYGFKALRIFENSQHRTFWGETILALARNYIDLNELQQANSMIHSAMHLAKINNDEKLLSDTYREYSLLLSKLQLYDSALTVADKAMQYYEKTGNTSYAGITYGRKSELYFLKKDYKNSIYYTKKSIKTDLRVGNKRALSIEYFHAAENYFRMHKIDSALAILETSMSLANYIGNVPLQIRGHSLLAAIYENQHKTSDALAQFKIISHLKDSLQSREKSRQLAETLALNELENKEEEIQLLEDENRIEKKLIATQQLVSYFLAIVILLLVSLVIVLWRLRRNQTKAHALLSSKNKAIEKQRKEIQEQAENLQTTSELKTKLFSVISHDLRGPISNIQMLLHLMTQRLMTHEEFLTMSEKLKADLNVNQRTLENLLNWSLSQMDGIKTQQKPLDLESLINDVSQLMKEIALQKEITIQNLSGCTCSVLADHNQVHLILRNIIHNAIKFSPNKKSIFISTHPMDTYCKVVIRDEGVGLSESEIETLLSPNDYYSKAGTHREKGTGLGLLLCKEFIKRNRGTFHITSVPGQGTEVSFTLPLA